MVASMNFLISQIGENQIAVDTEIVIVAVVVKITASTNSCC